MLHIKRIKTLKYTCICMYNQLGILCVYNLKTKNSIMKINYYTNISFFRF